MLGLFKPQFGLVENFEHENDPRNLRYADISAGDEAAPQPISFILSDDGPVQNQGQTASCVAHGVLHAHDQMSKTLSPRFLFHLMKRLPEFPSSQLSYGAYVVDGLKALQKYGSVGLDIVPNVPVGSDKDYLSFTLTDALKDQALPNAGGSYVQVVSADYNKQDLRFEQIKDFIWRERRPVVISVKWYSSYNKARRGGLLPLEEPSGTSVGHCMAVMGWITKNGHEYLVIKNSWGPSWGDKGNLYFPKSFGFISGGWGWLPATSIFIPKPVPVPAPEKNVHKERANAQELSALIKLNYPERFNAAGQTIFETPLDSWNGRTRAQAGLNWLLLIHALTYKGYVMTDILAWLRAWFNYYKTGKRTAAQGIDFTKHK